MKTNQAIEQDIAAARKKAYQNFKSKVQSMNYDFREGFCECRVSYDKIVGTLTSLPSWLEPNFIDMLNLLVSKDFYESATAFVNAYIEKNSIKGLLELVTVNNRDVEFTLHTREFLLLFSIQQLMPQLCKALIEDHKISPNYWILVRDGWPEGCEGLLHHFLQFDEKKPKEFMSILNTLLEGGADIFARAHFRRQGNQRRLFVPNLLNPYKKDRAVAPNPILILSHCMPILFAHGLGLIHRQARLKHLIKEESLESFMQSTADDAYLLKQPKFKDLDSHKMDMCNRELITKMITSPIAMKLELRDNSWKWIFTVDELRKVAENIETLSIAQQKRIIHIFRSIGGSVRKGEQFIATGVSDIVEEFFDKKMNALQTTADKLNTLGFSRQMRNILLSYTDEDIIVKSFLQMYEPESAPKQNPISCVIL